MPNARTFLTTQTVAQMLETGTTTVQRWVDAGELKAFKTPGGHRRIKRGDLLNFLRANRMPVPHALMSQVRLLIIDDQPQFLRGLALSLRRHEPRLEVEIAENGAAGLLEVGVHRPHVVFLDAAMEGIDGFDICERLKRDDETRGIYVVGVSGRASNQQRFRAAGADGFLLKPLGVRDALAQLAALELVELHGEPPRAAS